MIAFTVGAVLGGIWAAWTAGAWQVGVMTFAVVMLLAMLCRAWWEVRNDRDPWSW